MADLVPVDAGQRGSLTVADRVIDKLAEQAATQVPGVVSSGSSLDMLVGRRLPRVSSDVRGGQTRVDVEIAVQWPMALGDVATSVRSAVTDAVTAYAGLTVVAVDVTVARVEQTVGADTRRVE